MESLKKHLLNSGNRGPGQEMQSVFFVDNDSNSFIQTIQTCYESVVEYMDVWKKFDGAGTHLLESLRSSMKDSAYEKLGVEASDTFKVVHSSSNGIDPEGNLKEIEKLLIGLRSHLEASEKGEKTPSHLQVLCQCVLLFLKVQSDYHQMCSIAIATLLQKLVQTYSAAESKDVLQQMKDLDLLPPSPRESPSRSFSPLKKRSPITSPKTQSKHNTLKSSFLSLFEKKSSQDESKCAFYVDLDQPGANQSAPGPGGQAINNSQSEILVQIGLDPVREIDSAENLSNVLDHMNLIPQKSAGSEQRTKSPLATDEELDCVINLLSGSSGQLSSHMETIPENHMHLSLPSVYNSRTPSPREIDDSMKVQRCQMQRHSEGSIDFTGFATARGNTWPHRSSLPCGSLQQSANLYDGRNYNATIPRRFSHDSNLNSRSSSKYPNFLGQGNMMPGYQWGYHDPKYSNKTWQNNTLSSQGSDTMNSSWSAIPDSDDLSDDSSCGEQFFAVGLDLVHAMDSNQGESSDEEQEKSGKSAATDESQSCQDLTGSDRQTGYAWPSNNLWPPGSQGQGLVGGDVRSSSDKGLEQLHRPVCAQWSDPLANRSMWSASAVSGSQGAHKFGPLQ